MRDFDVEVRFAPYLLDPTTPPEGKPRRQYSQPGDGSSPLEQRGEQAGVAFTRGRTWTSNSHLALEAAEFVSEYHPELAIPLHRAMFKAYFTDLQEIGSVDQVVAIAGSVGVPADALQPALESGAFRQQVDDGIRWAREIGVTGVPTFVFNEQYGVVGAQDYLVFEDLMRRIGAKRKS